MAKIYYRRQDVDFVKFIFDNIGENSIIIVPEQLTFQIERSSFQHLNKKAILGVDILGFSRLGYKILKDKDKVQTKIDAQGKNMLITKIAIENAHRLKLFQNIANQEYFADMIQDTIRDLKQNNISSQVLQNTVKSINENIILKEKLEDIALIFEEYEDVISKGFLDTQDYVDLYNLEIAGSDIIKDKDIWIYGFDAFDEKRIRTIELLNEYAKSLNIVLTYDEDYKNEKIFFSGKKYIDRFSQRLNLDSKDIIKIGDEYKFDRNEKISLIEENLFKLDKKISTDSDNSEAVNIVNSANPYYEAINLASVVSDLVYNKDVKPNEIFIVASRLEEYKNMYKSVFKDFNLDIFIDEPRNLKANKVVAYINSILHAIKSDFDEEDVIEYLKNTFIEDKKAVEELEIYAKNYFVDGEKWKKPFEKGRSKYTEEDFDTFNKIRLEYISPLVDLKEKLDQSQIIKEKVEQIFSFLIDRKDLLKEIEKDIKEDTITNIEEALEMKQVWNELLKGMSQMIILMGDVKTDTNKFIDIFKRGINSIDIGIIPPTTDALVVGDLNRSQKDITRFTMILGCNEGYFPAYDEASGIINQNEIERLKKINIDIANSKEDNKNYKNLNIYKIISSTKEQVYLSYCSSEKDGSKIEKSNIIEDIKEIVNAVEDRDCISKGDVESLIFAKEIGKTIFIHSLMDMVKKNIQPEKKIEILYEILKDEEDVQDMIEKMSHVFGYEDVSQDLIKELYYMGEYLKISPSRLENFGKCPFAHFMRYGLKLYEDTPYQIKGNDLGSIYHRCIREFSEKIISNSIAKDKIDDELIKKELKNILDNIYEDYNEGILNQDGEGEYRKERILQVCFSAIKSLINQILDENIDYMMFEKEFGRGKDIDGVNVGEDAVIEGQIDRLDIIKGDISRVVDYKSGKDTFDISRIRRGLSLQLMIYLMASHNIKNRDIRSGGSFYFSLLDDIEHTKKKKSQKDSMQKLDGFYVEELGKLMSKATAIVHKNREFSKEEFDNFENEIYDLIKDMTKDMKKGKIDAIPKRIGDDESSCTYCNYKGICKFDITLDSCRYEK